MHAAVKQDIFGILQTVASLIRATMSAAELIRTGSVRESIPRPTVAVANRDIYGNLQVARLIRATTSIVVIIRTGSVRESVPRPTAAAARKDITGMQHHTVVTS